ncbi:DUF4183 domain-containing protein [Paenibacillus sp. HW567]|uniref:DUF4183 domain-containing protein n=1 Tax=Paenibacillus sp. HW567 TaxID=1034769 RepID=UPI000A0584D0|nr:DUF4183 domain-containing protein [Paenibacillus sp. HW567]
MAIIKLFLKAINAVTGGVNTTTTVTVTPSVNRYTATVVIGNIGGGTTTIPAPSFNNDGGTAVPVGGLVVPTSSGYYNLFVNGTLQRGGLSTLTASNLVINTALVIGVTVVVEVINFTTASTSTSTNNISVSTTISY